ncbi:MAG TPA: MFS transporter [Actinopolymorphaceae bacterium]|nr:MFS transporter [Actinopolymorphaceae bacterium]
MFRSLRIRNYRYYAAGSAVSNIGTWLQRVAQDWLVLQLTGSGTALGITTALQFLPFLLIAPFGGLIADRFPKRRVLQCTQVAMGLTAAVLAVLDLTGVVQTWHVYLLAFLFGVAGAIDNPARQSFVVEMVGKDDLANAVGLNSASFNGARVIGPAVAGLMIMLVGTGWVILANALTYGATIWALTKMRRSELHTPTPVPRKPGMLMDAVLYVRGRPDLIMVLTVVFFVGCFGLNFQLTSALMATHVFGKGAGGYGILGSVMAVGAVAGALGAARRGSPRLRLVLAAAIGFGILEVASGLMPTYLSFTLSLPLLGFAQLTMITAANAMMQLTVTPEMRGRVIALYSMVFIGSTPIGSPIVGWVGESFGPRWTLIGGGLVSALGALVAGAIVLRRDQLVVRAHLRPRPHVHVWTPADLAEAPATTASPVGTGTTATAPVPAGVGATAIGATALGATAVGATALDATAAGAVGGTAIGGAAVGATAVSASADASQPAMLVEAVEAVEAPGAARSGRVPATAGHVEAPVTTRSGRLPATAGHVEAPVTAVLAQPVAPDAQPVATPARPMFGPRPVVPSPTPAYDQRSGAAVQLEAPAPATELARSGADDAELSEVSRHRDRETFDKSTGPDGRERMSAEGEKVPACNPPVSSRCSKPTARDSWMWRPRASTHRSRRARAGRSTMS